MFTADARDQTDLNALTAQVMTIVQQTIQPEYLGKWIKPQGPRER